MAIYVPHVSADRHTDTQTQTRIQTATQTYTQTHTAPPLIVSLSALCAQVNSASYSHWDGK